jgi:phage portal protein BeeE
VETPVSVRTWIDGLRERFSRPGIEPSGAAVFSTTYGLNGNEAVLPTQVADTYQAFSSNSIVFGAMLARMSLFSEATFAFRDRTDKHLFGADETDGRRLTALRKLENPWGNATTGELLARMIQDVDLAGNAYIWATDEGELVRLRPDWVTIISELAIDSIGRRYRRVIGYYWEPPQGFTDEGPPALFGVDEIAHWSPNPDPWANFRGMSWLTPVLREVAADNLMTAYKTRYLTNAASPNLLLRYTQRLGNKSIDNIRDRIEARHGGLDNAFRTLVLDEGADATVIGNNFEQMSFSTVQAAGENRIVIASGVPGIVIGAKEGLAAATYSNYEQALRRFADLTMRPLWRSVCACLASIVTVPNSAKLWYDISDIAALRQGEQQQAETMLVKAQAVAELVNAQFEPKSAVEAITSGDMSLLEFKEKVEQPPPQFPSLDGAVDETASKIPTANGTAVTNGRKTPAMIGAN